jgi:hypothetical protein
MEIRDNQNPGIIVIKKTMKKITRKKGISDRRHIK